MSFPRYPSYKDSGVVGLGEVPSHWDVKPLKHLAAIDSCGSYGVEVEEAEITLPVATTAQIDADGRFAVDRMPVRGFVSAEVQRFGCSDGDILVVKSSGSATNIISGKVGLVDKATPPFVFSNFLMRVRPSRELATPKFIYALLRSQLTRQRVEQMCSTTTYPNLQVGEYCSAPLPIPSPAEQVAIADFLDRETEKIDKLVAEQRRLIELLKEKRQAVISHAVTRGLNPAAALKPSGIEWLGDVPAHWDVSRFGLISSVVRGGSPRPAGDPTLFNGDYSPWVTVAEITKDDQIDLTETETFLTKKGSEQCRVFSKDTLLLSNSGGSLGVPKILRIEANANDGVLGFENLSLDPHFAYFYLSTLTDHLRETVRRTGGSTQINLNTSLLKQLPVPVPPSTELTSIVAHIRSETELYSSLTAEAQRAIDLLQERRTALISVAVTGQIDVRPLIEKKAA